MGQINFEIIKEFGIISESEVRGMRKEVNIVSWNNRKPKLDIREWSLDHEFAGKGVTLAMMEYFNLSSMIDKYGVDIIKILDPTMSFFNKLPAR